MEKIRAMLEALAKASLTEKLSKEQVKSYFHAIKDYPPELVLSVLSKYSYLPPINELVKKLEEKRTLLAFEILQKAIEKAGIYGAVVFEDRKLQAFVKLMGGWQEICEMSPKELRYWFFRLYPEIEPDGGREEIFTTEYTLDDAKILRVKPLSFYLEEKVYRALPGGENGGI